MALQVTRIIFTNSMVFVVCSIILTVLLIYAMERYVFGSSKKQKNKLISTLFYNNFNTKTS